MKLSSYAKKLGIHYNTAYRMFKRGQIAGYQLPTGTVIIEEPIEQTVTLGPKPHLVAVYARVSSSENKKNLDTQAERLITWCNAPSLVGRGSRQRVWQWHQRSAAQVSVLAGAERDTPDRGGA